MEEFADILYEQPNGLLLVQGYLKAEERSKMKELDFQFFIQTPNFDHLQVTHNF